LDLATSQSIAISMVLPPVLLGRASHVKEDILRVL